MRVCFLVGLVLVAWWPLAGAQTFQTLPAGTLRHTPSGFLFPEQVGDFVRGETTVYDDKGLDVSAGYDLESARVVATVYVYPAPAGPADDVLKNEFRLRVAEVSQGHKGTEILSFGKTMVRQGGEMLTGREAYFTYRDSPANLPLKSRLIIFLQGARFVAYRFTYPIRQATAAERAVDRFIEDWSWRSPAAGGARTSPPITE